MNQRHEKEKRRHHVAALLAAKKSEQYCHVMAYVRCKLSFSLLSSCSMCVRGSRKLFGRPVVLKAGASSAALAVLGGQVPV